MQLIFQIVENINIKNINKLSGEIYWTPLTTTQDFGYDTLINYQLEVSYGNVHYYEDYSG